MIYTTFKIYNPYSNRFSNVLTLHGKLTLNKAWEFEILKTNLLFGFTLEFKTRTDHAGLHLELGLFGYELSGMIYDTRHYPHSLVK